MCVWRDIDVKVDVFVCGLGEDVPNLRFVMGVESSAVETELVLGFVAQISTPCKLAFLVLL